MADTSTRPRGGDLLLVGADVVDGGPGSRRCAADVLLRDGLVEAVEPRGSIPSDGRHVVDLAGHVLAPGFIDVHSHADNAPLLDADDTTKILQGVTSEIVGNCGFSLAPVAEAQRDQLKGLTSRIFPDIEAHWSSFADLMAVVDERGFVTNYAPLVGHGTLRLAVAGFDDRPTTPGERAEMARLASEAVAAGAFGVSTGLIYPPGLFGDTDEISDLVAALPAHAVYATHMRGEGRHLLASIDEATAVGRRTGHQVQISHLKAAGASNWGTVPAALDRIERARREGVHVLHDVYPYTAASTMLTACLPPWVQEGGNEAVLERLQDDRTLGRIRSEIDGGPIGTWENHVYGAGWDGVLVSSTASHQREGLTLAEIAEAEKTDPFTALVHVLVDERLRASMVVFSMREDDLEAALRDPHTMIGSDGLPPGVGGKPHPRLVGTFPRVLARYVRERHTLDLETAVHRMTGLPAETFHLAGRGRVLPGYVADLVAFDPVNVLDDCDFRSVAGPPKGISTVVQAGEIVVQDGTWVGKRRGRRLVPGATGL